MKSQIGDAFVFLSDGLPEVENQNGEMLGYKAVLECIKSNGHLSAEEIKQIVSSYKNEHDLLIGDTVVRVLYLY